MAWTPAPPRYLVAKLVVAAGKSARSFEGVEAAFDHVAVAIGVRVEAGRARTAALPLCETAPLKLASM
jgi:hypothetical protein